MLYQVSVTPANAHCFSWRWSLCRRDSCSMHDHAMLIQVEAQRDRIVEHTLIVDNPVQPLSRAEDGAPPEEGSTPTTSDAK